MTTRCTPIRRALIRCYRLDDEGNTTGDPLPISGVSLTRTDQSAGVGPFCAAAEPIFPQRRYSITFDLSPLIPSERLPGEADEEMDRRCAREMARERSEGRTP